MWIFELVPPVEKCQACPFLMGLLFKLLPKASCLIKVFHFFSFQFLSIVKMLQQSVKQQASVCEITWEAAYTCPEYWFFFFFFPPDNKRPRWSESIGREVPWAIKHTCPPPQCVWSEKLFWLRWEQILIKQGVREQDAMICVLGCNQTWSSWAGVHHLSEDRTETALAGYMGEGVGRVTCWFDIFSRYVHTPAYRQPAPDNWSGFGLLPECGTESPRALLWQHDSPPLQIRGKIRKLIGRCFFSPFSPL